MKSIYGAALAALVGTVAAKDERTFAVLRFTNEGLTKGRMDPIISPGKTSNHVHTVMGGSGFGKSATGDDLVNSKCSNAKIKGDNSAYWFPSLYFKDPDSGKFEDVDVNYVNVYYFFEPTDDEIKAFPPGLQIVAGDVNTRTPPKSGAETNLDPSKGDIMNIKWTCPRLDNNYSPPSWPADSDGSKAGIGDPINKGEGVGFPDVDCDGLYSPLRADIHMPSCYNPEAGLDDYKNNMAWPEDNGSGKQNCPKGYTHLPHLFFEVYWDTPKFADRWTGNTGKQPFVLSNGDATGYSSHADFMAGWDEDLLQHIIDTCDAGTLGMDQCDGLNGLNEDDCTIESEVDEKVDGTLDALPGNCPLLGWAYGLDGLDDLISGVGDIVNPSSSSQPAASSAASSSAAGLPEQVATNAVENPYQPESTTPSAPPKATSVQVEAQSEEPAQETTQAPEPPAPEPTQQPTTTSCSKKVKTVWETVTVTENVYAEPTSGVSAAGNDTGAVAGFQFAGCFKDSDERALSDIVRPDIGKVSNEKCVSHCKEAGFQLAGTEYGGECYCGNELVGSKQLNDTDCATPCTDDPADVCGGDWALSVYSESGEASIKSAKVRRHLHAHHVHGHRRSHH